MSRMTTTEATTPAATTTTLPPPLPLHSHPLRYSPVISSSSSPTTTTPSTSFPVAVPLSLGSADNNNSNSKSNITFFQRPPRAGACGTVLDLQRLIRRIPTTMDDVKGPRPVSPSSSGNCPSTWFFAVSPLQCLSSGLVMLPFPPPPVMTNKNHHHHHHHHQQQQQPTKTPPPPAATANAKETPGNHDDRKVDPSLPLHEVDDEGHAAAAFSSDEEELEALVFSDVAVPDVEDDDVGGHRSSYRHKPTTSSSSCASPRSSKKTLPALTTVDRRSGSTRGEKSKSASWSWSLGRKDTEPRVASSATDAGITESPPALSAHTVAASTIPPTIITAAPTTAASGPQHEPMIRAFLDDLDDLQQSLEQVPHKSAAAAAAKTPATASAASHISFYDAAVLQPRLLAFAAQCREFRTTHQKSVHLSVGYHYTSRKYLGHIRKHGLLTRGERVDRGIKVVENGSTHGDGIYTSSNPTAFRGFREHTDVALYVLRLTSQIRKHSTSTTGKRDMANPTTSLNTSTSTSATKSLSASQQTASSSSSRLQFSSTDQYVDTIIRNRGPGRDVVLLRRSSQCVVLGELDPRALDQPKTAHQITLVHGQLRNLIRVHWKPHFRNTSSTSSSDNATSPLPPQVPSQPPKSSSTGSLASFLLQQHAKDETKKQDRRPDQDLKTESPREVLSRLPARKEEAQPISSSRQTRQRLKQSSRTSSTSSNNSGRRRIAKCAEIKYHAPRLSVVEESQKSQAVRTTESFHCQEALSASTPLDCSICFEPLIPPGDNKSATHNPRQCSNSCRKLSVLKRCGHIFHADCMSLALNFDVKCPVCRKPTSEPRGKQPSGKLVIAFDDESACGGYSTGLWRLEYRFKDGEQRPYHPNPGAAYRGTHRTAFIPDCEEGRRLLKRLMYAFHRGLTFTIGTSLTTGKDNVITWASIHHKTKCHGGPHGFPDPGYFYNCNEELDALGVPPHDDPEVQILLSVYCSSSKNMHRFFGPDAVATVPLVSSSAAQVNQDDDKTRKKSGFLKPPPSRLLVVAE